jgi:hypothetical protein
MDVNDKMKEMETEDLRLRNNTAEYWQCIKQTRERGGTIGGTTFYNEPTTEN